MSLLAAFKLTVYSVGAVLCLATALSLLVQWFLTKQAPADAETARACR